MELIDRDSFGERIGVEFCADCEKPVYGKPCGSCKIATVLHLLESMPLVHSDEAPAAALRTAVLCGDCRHSYFESEKSKKGFCNHHEIVINRTNFCDAGEDKHAAD